MSNYQRLLHIKKYIPVPVKSAFKKLLLQYRSLNKSRVLPNFIIIGVQKGGTTSLFNYLVNHHQIIAPTHKQTFYFDRYYNKPLSYYKAAFPTKLQVENHINVHGKALTGEATPDYFYFPEVPHRIKDCGLNTNFIVIYREPYSRCISEYNYLPIHFNNKLGVTNYFKQEIKSYKKYINAGLSYPELAKHFNEFPIISRSLYDLQYNHWISIFDKSQFLFLKNENLKNKPLQTLNKISLFLGILPFTIINERTYNKTTRKKEYPSEEVKIELQKILNEHYNNFLKSIDS